MARLGPPFWPPSSPRKSLCGSPPFFLRSSPEMSTNIFSWGLKRGLFGLWANMHSVQTRGIAKTSGFAGAVCKIGDFNRFKGFLVEILREQFSSTWEIEAPQTKSPDEWTFQSLAIYNAPNLHAVVEQCQVVVFIADDLGFWGPGSPDLMTKLCPPQDTA